MSDLPEDDNGLAETRAALAPTLDATAAILPWIAKARAPRFDSALNERWINASQALAATWAKRHFRPQDEVRPALFILYGIALETQDSDCLLLGEALADAADRLESHESPALIAALTAAIETLADPSGLEHPNFPERAQHFARRLGQAAKNTANASVRSPLIDHLFVEESVERIEHMRCALAVLPADAYALKNELAELLQHAEQVELWGIVHYARDFAAELERHHAALDDAGYRDQIADRIDQLWALIDAIEP